MQLGSLRVLAQEAHAQTLADEAALRRKEDESTRQQIEAALSNLFNTPVTASLAHQRYHNFPIIEADHLRFTLVTGGDMGKQLVFLDVCPTCGKECASEPINHLAQLGAVMANFEPDNNHSC